MKKILIIIFLVISLLGIWKYASNLMKKSQTAKEIKESVQDSVDYVPNAIERKNTMGSKIQDTTQAENERLQKTLQELP